MDLLIRYFDSVDRKVKTWYLESRFLGQSSHCDLFDQHNMDVQGLDNCNICQVSMDGPSLNLKFIQKVQDHRVENEQPALIDIVSCGLHTVHGTFIYRAQSTGQKPKEILRWFSSNSLWFFRKEGWLPICH